MSSECDRCAGMRSAVVVIVAVGICGPFAHAADIAAGKEKAELCVGCHGENGISQMENIPSLAGQPDQFIQWQLVFFRAGARKNEQMQPIVEQINNEDIRNLGAYFASLTPPKATKPDDNPDLSKKGAQAAVGRRCASCHTDTYRRHQGRRPHRRPARGISGQGAARLQIGRAIRRRHGGDGGCRLSPQRRGDRSAGALSRAFVRQNLILRSALRRASRRMERRLRLLMVRDELAESRDAPHHEEITPAASHTP